MLNHSPTNTSQLEESIFDRIVRAVACSPDGVETLLAYGAVSQHILPLEKSFEIDVSLGDHQVNECGVELLASLLWD